MDYDDLIADDSPSAWEIVFPREGTRPERVMPIVATTTDAGKVWSSYIAAGQRCELHKREGPVSLIIVPRSRLGTT